jgi:NADPH:quinone reductase-like Zn-dependent oxidoreductase
LLPAGGDIVLGHECAGRVVAIGDGVTTWKVGDEVVALAKLTLGSFVRTPAALVAAAGAARFRRRGGGPHRFLTAHYALNHLARLRRARTRSLGYRRGRSAHPPGPGRGRGDLRDRRHRGEAEAAHRWA